MALKMPKARLINLFGVETTVDAATYDKSAKPGRLLCIDTRCDAALRHVPLNRRADRDIRAYFGRTPNSEHSRNCKFNVAATVTRIAARSARFEEARDPIAIDPDGTAVLRLGIVLDALVALDRNPAADGNDARVPECVDVVVGDRMLPRYLRRARAILALIARLGDTDELKDALRISYGGANVPWRDFFYGPGELGQLYGRLQALQGADRPFHPVAVVLRPTRGRTTTARDAVVKCRFEELTILSGGTVRIAPRLSCRPPDLAGALNAGRSYLLCGLPRPRRGDLNLSPASEITEYADVYMDVVSRNQLAVWPH